MHACRLLTPYPRGIRYIRYLPEAVAVLSATNHHTGLHAVSQSATVEVEDKYNTAAMLMTRVAFLGTVATALRAGSARRAPFWRRSQTTMSFSIQDTVAASDVVVFSKSWCPFCQKTKKALTLEEIPFTAVELDERDDGQDIQDALAEMTGQRTVPSVFIKGTHVGGNDDTQRGLRDGSVQRMLAEKASS